MSGEGSASIIVVNGNARGTEIENLMKYTEYTVFVQANTSVGGGDRSESVTVVTDEDGEFIYMVAVGVCIQYSFVFWDALQINCRDI